MSDAGSEEEEDQGPSLGVSFHFVIFLRRFSLEIHILLWDFMLVFKSKLNIVYVSVHFHKI